MPGSYKGHAPLLLAALALFFSLWLFAANLWANRGQAFEDSYITFRYAYHLAEGQGLVWNPGGAPTEGFTNLLLVLMVALIAPFQNDPLLAVRTMSIAAALGTAFLLGRISVVYLKLPLLMATAIACLWLTYLPTALHSVYGLETVLFTFLLLLLAYQTFRYETHRRPRDLILLLAVGTLLLLTRPEGIAYMGLALFWLLLQPQRNLKAILSAGVGYALIIGAWFLLRYLYFGDWLPNPFLIKTNGAGDALPGIAFVVYFMVDMGLLLPWVLAAMVRRNAYLRFCTLLMLFGLGFYAFVRHEMGIHHRFLFPTVPFWFLMAGAGITPLLDAVAQRLNHPRAATLSYGLLLVAVLLWHPHEWIENEPLPVRWSRLTFNSPAVPDGAVAINHEMGTILASLGQGTRLVCLNEDAGVMPFVSDCYHIDPVGLNDNTVARMTTPTAYTDYLFGTRPDIMFLRSHDPDWNIEREIACPFGSHGKLADFSRAVLYRDARFADYALLGSVPDGWGYHFHIALRRASPLAPALRDAFTPYIHQKAGVLHPPTSVAEFDGDCPLRDSSDKGMR
jgi:hypothetical protein